MRLAQLIRDDQRFQSAMEKYTCLMIAHYANASGKNIYPGVDLLAKTMLVSEKTVRRCLKRLIASGMVKEIGRHGLNKQYEIPMHDLWTEKQINPHNKPKKVKLVSPDEDISDEDTQEVPSVIDMPADNPEDERIRRLMLAVRNGKEAQTWKLDNQWKKNVVEKGEQAQRELDLLSKEVKV